MNRYPGMALSVAAITLLAAAYSSQVGWISWAVLLLVAIAWLSEPWHRHGTIVSLAFAGFTALVAVAALNTFSPFLLLTALILATAGWDLLHFAQYLEQVEEADSSFSVTRQHWERLALVLGAGWLLGILLLNVRLRVSLTWALALALLALFGLSRSIRRLRRESD